jgi:hypothetical protein
MHPVSCLLEPHSLGRVKPALSAPVGIDEPIGSPKAYPLNANQPATEQLYLMINDDSRLGIPVDHRSVQCFIRAMGANLRAVVERSLEPCTIYLGLPWLLGG